MGPTAAPTTAPLAHAGRARPWVLRWAPWALAGLVAVHLAVVALRLPEGRRLPVSHLLQFAIEAAGAALVWVAVATMPRGHDRRSWTLMAAAATSYALGVGYLVFLDLAGRALAYPSAADVLWLAFPLLASASFLWRSLGAGRSQAVVRALDALITGTAVFLVAWVFWFGAVVSGASGGFLARLATAAYPFGDVLILTSLLAFAATLSRERLATLWPLFGGVLLIWATDVAYTWQALHGNPSTAGVPEAGWPLGFALVAYGAARAAHGTPAQKAGFTELDRWLPYAVALLAILALAYTVVVGRYSRVIMGTAVAWVTLLLFRQIHFFRQYGSAQRALLEERLRGAASEQKIRGLQELADFKGRFINTAAHELTTPLTPIRLLLAALRRETIPGHAESIELLERNVDRLATLLADILESARMQSNEMRLRTSDVDLSEIARSAAQDLERAFEDAGIAFAQRVEDGIRLRGDGVRLHQAVLNLLDNARKFTPRGGRVELAASRTPAGARITVRDSGDGIPADALPGLFHPFAQANNLAGSPGTGLGLYITKGIVERHGGSVRAESAGKGAGATFTFELPREPPEPGPEPQAFAARPRPGGKAPEAPPQPPRVEGASGDRRSS
jgi:signal transduction histidine kinase